MLNFVRGSTRMQYALNVATLITLVDDKLFYKNANMSFVSAFVICLNYKRIYEIKC